MKKTNNINKNYNANGTYSIMDEVVIPKFEPNHITPTARIMINIKNLDICMRAVLEKGLKQMEADNTASFGAVIPLKWLSIPKFQRKENLYMIRKIKKEFDPLLVEFLIINFNAETGEWELLDGHHTAIALLELGYKNAQVKVYVNLTKEEKAKIFVSQQKKKRTLSSRDEYWACLWGNIGNARIIDKVVNKYGVTVGEKYGTLKNITSFRKLDIIINKYGEDGLDFVLKVIHDSLWADAKAYTEASLNIGFFAYEKCKDDEDAYEDLKTYLRSFDTAGEFSAQVVKEFTEISDKHPEYGVASMIRKFFEER